MKEKMVIGFLRVSLAASFLSAVLDRFGVWGKPGSPGVAWGNVENFLSYTAVLNPWVPASLIGVVGWSATILEIVLGVLLILGFRLKEVATLSGLLLGVFSLSMIATVGIKGPLDYSVFTASAAAFSLAILSSTKKVSN